MKDFFWDIENQIRIFGSVMGVNEGEKGFNKNLHRVIKKENKNGKIVYVLARPRAPRSKFHG